MPELHPLVWLSFLAAILAVFFTGVVKLMIARWWDEEPSWHDPFLRVASPVLAALVCLAGVTQVEQPWYLLILIGLGVGSKATVVIDAIKGILVPWVKNR